MLALNLLETNLWEGQQVPLWGERENSTGLVWIKNYRQGWATTKTPVKIVLLLYEDSDLQLITGIVVIRETAEKQLVSIIAVILSFSSTEVLSQ